MANYHALASAPAFAQLLGDCRGTEWVVYAKRPFGGPAQVLDYLGRYTHKVALSNHRLLKVEDGNVSFHWKDYRCNRQKVMTLEATEFLREHPSQGCSLLHILPEGFVRIRHFGLLANRHRAQNLALCRQRLEAAEPPPRDEPVPPSFREHYLELTGVDLSLCPQCGLGRLVRMQILPAVSYPWVRAAPNGDSS